MPSVAARRCTKPASFQFIEPAYPRSLPGECAPGALFHWVTLTDDGIRATDVWHDREAFERFAEEQIGTCAAAVGIQGPPKVSVFEVHNYLTAA